MSDEPKPTIQLQPMDGGVAYLKAGFLGFPKSGKTYTATELAIACRRHFGLEAPIAMFDTEAGGAYIAPLVKEQTGQSLLGVRSRAFDDLIFIARGCEEGTASVLIVDSITHVWREVCEAYLAEVNAARRSQNKADRTRLEFQDWANIKRKWGEWTTFYLNSQLHIIICGRAGFEWDFQTQENADGSERKELVKTGIKMKVESEFGFEPSLLVHMERVSDYDERAGEQRYIHRAHVIGDRFQILDGKIADNPTAEFFLPHLHLLTPGADNTVNTAPKTRMGVDEAGHVREQRQRRQREVLCDEIKGLMTMQWPGRSGAEQKAKIQALEACFNTHSWKKVEGMRVATLKAGLNLLRNHIQELQTDG